MILTIRARNILLCFIYCISVISADRASEANHYPRKDPYCSLDDMNEILNHTFIAHDRAEYSINFDGPLNPLFGYLYRNSNLLANKRFFSYGIKLKSSCDCLKNNGVREGNTNNRLTENDRICISHRLLPPEYDTAFELYEGQKTRRGGLELDYLYDYHSCLIDMFKSTNRKKIFRSLKDSFSYFMETLPEDTAERFLAVLFLLPENVYSVINSSVDCSGQDHSRNGLYYCGAENTADERVVFHSGAFEFELEYNTVEHGELIVRNSIKSIINFFSDCGTKYKEIAEIKRKASRKHGNDAAHLIETPEFLVQNYIYEYCKNSWDKHIRIAKNILRLLNEAGNDKLFRKYFTQIGSEDEDAVNNRRHVEAALSSYKKEFHKVLGVYNALPLNFMEELPEPKFYNMYNRGLDNAMNDRFVNYTETAVFSILCILFYDCREQCFKLPPGVELRDKRLQKLFSNQAFIIDSPGSPDERRTVNYGKPNGTYDSGMHDDRIELSEKDLNGIFGDLPDKHILYDNIKVCQRNNAPPTVVRNMLRCDLFNIAYVLAYMTGKTEFMSLIREARKRSPRNNMSIKESEAVVEYLLSSLKYNKDLKIEMVYRNLIEAINNNASKAIIKYVTPDYIELKVEILFEHIPDIVVYAHNRSPLMESLRNLEKQSREIKDKHVLLDLLCKAIEYDLDAKFRNTSGYMSRHISDDRIRAIADISLKEEIIDKWLAILNVFNFGLNLKGNYYALILFIDETRHLVSDCGMSPTEKSKMRNFLFNTVIYRLSQFKEYLTEFGEKYIKYLFMAVYGIKSKEIAPLQRCKNTRIVEKAVCNFRFMEEYSGLINASYYLNWYLAENCLDKDVDLTNMYNAVTEHFRLLSGIGCRHEYGIYCIDKYRYCSENFYLNLYYKMKDSNDKKHIDRFVKGFPDDPNALVSLFCECLMSKGYLKTKIYEVVSKFLISMEIKSIPSSSKPIKLDGRFFDSQIFDTCKSEAMHSWEDLFSLTEKENNDINQVWEACDYILNNTDIQSKGIPLEQLKDNYEKIKIGYYEGNTISHSNQFFKGRDIEE